MTVTLLLVLSLAAYRLGRLASQEDGPMDLASRMRQHIGQRTWLGRGVHCCLCCSFWFALIGVLYLAATGRVLWRDLPLFWFASAGGAAAVYQVFR
jgi:hypothetical protein